MQKSSVIFTVQKLNTLTEKFKSDHNKEIIFNYYKNKNLFNISSLDDIVNELNKKRKINLYNKVSKEVVVDTINKLKLAYIKDIINEKFYNQMPRTDTYLFSDKIHYDEYYLVGKWCPHDPNYKYICVDNKLYVLNELTNEVNEIVGYGKHFYTAINLLIIAPIFYFPPAWTLFASLNNIPRYLYIKYWPVTQTEENRIKSLIKQRLYDLEYNTQKNIYKHMFGSCNKDHILIANVLCEFYKKFFTDENKKNPIKIDDLILCDLERKLYRLKSVIGHPAFSDEELPIW